MAIVAIIGRPNVGKSTLFNRLTQSRRAIVDDLPGVTRDRLYADVEWQGRHFFLMDTAGIMSDARDGVEAEVQEQVKLAINESDLVVLLCDVRSGLHPEEKEIVREIRRVEKPLIVAVNKVDGPRQEELVGEFYELGVEEVIPLSAIHGHGVEDLLDRIVDKLPIRKEPPVDLSIQDNTDIIRMAVVGRPNVGKSQFVNCLLGMPRMVVSDMPGTTRDAVDVELEYKRRRFVLVDTAGIRRRARIKEKLEKICVVKSLESIDKSDIAVILIDATEGPTDQDLHIGGYIQRRYKGCIIGVNKWDLIQSDKREAHRVIEDVRRRFQFLPFAPVVPMSALTGQNVRKVLKLALEVFDQYSTRIGTGVLNRVFRSILEKHHPPQRGGRPLKFYYVTQPSTRPPTFVLFCNRPDDIHFSYERYLVNQFRSAFQLSQSPVRLIFRGRSGGVAEEA
ncbi:ribosome biogenesis GTPase Der [Thermodesulforhabdus norvegica]|uniref:GTPase Der n=1 Tax=Thermodesulforhabdus norvegica TaxID=39841 RepID=A0A1I4SRE3_9BACT|nr:ribosome biogenesis GTPase Der [Thermodesulforhabdus norvegica]SFM66883.1 GTP-binding protein [Thermodesulforhabdus norvegica]